uniref:Uncharacterized protein n=1 Tax=Candidatus Kentrum sp. DK TaxID=2126562 RepID=A0A450TMS1_9GAMM|nr:MAG: hypothetical protein BECKDK2373B_GA0170837_12312 [Candidatus Kentron sp. DK]
MLIGMNVVEVADEDFCPKWKIRHADLAAWCAGKGHPYPLPPLPNEASPLTTDAGLRETLASREEELEQSKSKAGKLQAEIARLHGELNSKNGEIEKLNADAPPSERSEKTYLNIIGGLVALMLGKSGVGKKPSVFRTQEVIIGKLLDDYESIKGISKSNLDTIMAKANDTLKCSLPKRQSAGNHDERVRP